MKKAFYILVWGLSLMSLVRCSSGKGLSVSFQDENTTANPSTQNTSDDCSQNPHLKMERISPNSSSVTVGQKVIWEISTECVGKYVLLREDEDALQFQNRIVFEKSYSSPGEKTENVLVNATHLNGSPQFSLSDTLTVLESAGGTALLTCQSDTPNAVLSVKTYSNGTLAQADWPIINFNLTASQDSRLTNVEINPQGSNVLPMTSLPTNVSKSHSYSIQPRAIGDYTLLFTVADAANPAVTATCSRFVFLIREIVPDPPTDNNNNPPPAPPAPTLQLTVNGTTAGTGELKTITASYFSNVDISWSSSNAQSCSLNPLGISNLSGDSKLMEVIANKTLELSCTNAVGTVKATVTVNVPCPAVSNFSGVINTDAVPDSIINASLPSKGYKIKATNISNTSTTPWVGNPLYPPRPCSSTSTTFYFGTNVGAPLVRFRNSSNNTVLETVLGQLATPIDIPSGVTSVVGVFIDLDYNSNSGSCSFNLEVRPYCNP